MRNGRGHQRRKHAAQRVDDGGSVGRDAHVRKRRGARGREQTLAPENRGHSHEYRQHEAARARCERRADESRREGKHRAASREQGSSTKGAAIDLAGEGVTHP